jgi:hypothetical protein
MDAALQRNQRAASRSNARMFVKIRNGTRVDGAMVVDISMTGLGAEMHDTSAQKPGHYVEVHSESLGYINGFVRWVGRGKIGIEFDLSSNNSAKVASFFKYFYSR